MNRPSRLATSSCHLAFAVAFLCLLFPTVAAAEDSSVCATTRSFSVHLVPADVLRLAESPRALVDRASTTDGAGHAAIRAGRGGARVRFAAGDRDYLLGFSVSCSQDPDTIAIRALELTLISDPDRGLAGEDLVTTNFEMPVGEPVTVSSLSGSTPLTLILAAR